MLARIAQKVWQPYLNALEKRPLITKMCTTATLMGSGDLLAQFVIEDRKDKKQIFDPIRFSRMAAIGFFINGPMLTYWYKFLDVNFTRWYVKLLLDQTLFAPTIVSTFFFSNGVMQGEPPGKVVNHIKSIIVPTMIHNWSVWPLAMFVNFKFVPGNLQVLYVSFIALMWNTYLSTVGNRKRPDEPKSH